MHKNRKGWSELDLASTFQAFTYFLKVQEQAKMVRIGFFFFKKIIN